MFLKWTSFKFKKIFFCAIEIIKHQFRVIDLFEFSVRLRYIQYEMKRGLIVPL